MKTAKSDIGANGFASQMIFIPVILLMVLVSTGVAQGKILTSVPAVSFLGQREVNDSALRAYRLECDISFHVGRKWFRNKYKSWIFEKDISFLIFYHHRCLHSEDVSKRIRTKGSSECIHICLMCSVKTYDINLGLCHQLYILFCLYFI